jgi:hypothetical protein
MLAPVVEPQSARARVPDEELLKWVETAHSARVDYYTLEQVLDPRRDSDLALDDAGYRWEKCSAWVRSYLMAAADHLLLWANTVSPPRVHEGMTVANPPRPYFTLARAALESAAQAVWILEPAESVERVHRHLRLLYHDLRQLALALEAEGDDRASAARERMHLVQTRTSDLYAFKTIKDGEPKYLMIVRECAEVIKTAPATLEAIWRGASASAHGKNWFQHVAFDLRAGEEYEQDYFRVLLLPAPSEITRAVQAASDMLTYGVTKFVLRAGVDPQPLFRVALERLASEIPRRPTDS